MMFGTDIFKTLYLGKPLHGRSVDLLQIQFSQIDELKLDEIHMEN